MKLQSISVQVSIIEIKELLEKNGIRKEQWEIIKDEIDRLGLKEEFDNFLKLGKAKTLKRINEIEKEIQKL